MGGNQGNILFCVSVKVTEEEVVATGDKYLAQLCCIQ